MYHPPIQIPGMLKYILPNYPHLRENMGIVIGQHGKNFKMITHYADIHYIWYNKKKNYIEVWGTDPNKVDHAIYLLHRHLAYFSPPPPSINLL
jgi:hypothetical protein